VNGPGGVLVTGAGGFLGSAIAGHLRRRRRSVLGVGRTPPAARSFDFRRLVLPSPAFAAVVRAFRPAVLVHAAGPASVPASMERPWRDLRASVDLLAFVLDVLRREAPACRVLFLSSAAVYGEPRRLPIREDDERRPISAYGVHKMLCEDLADAYGRLYGTRTCSVRIFSAYGEGLHRQVVFDMWRKLRRGGRVELHGTGEESRDFVHATDVARGVEAVIRAGDRARAAYNLSSGEETPISELAAQMRELVNPEARVTFTGAVRKGDPRRWHADVVRLSDLGFAARSPLRAGLRAVVRHWQLEADAD
jgi:UDP-glucose 4-epimerase